MKKFLLESMYIFVFTTIILLTFTICASATEKAMFPMEYLNISQGVNGSYSHKGRLAIDIYGKDSGIDAFCAPFTGTIKKLYGSDHVVWLESNSPVEYADGTVDYMTIMCMHDNDISDLWVGKTIYQGEHFLSEGTAGNATGNHIHLECGKGKFAGSGWYENSYGKWCINNGINPWQALFLSESTVVKNDYGYAWIKSSFNITEPPSNPNNLKGDKSTYSSSEKITLSWDPVTGASHYWVYMWKDGTELYATNMGNNTSFTSAPTSTGTYTFIVRAANSVGYSSGVSYTFTVSDDIPGPVTKIWSDKNIYMSNDNITFYWDKAYNANQYWVYLWKDGVQLSLDCTDSNTYYNTKVGDAGTYTLIIRPCNTNGFNEGSTSYSFIVHDYAPANLGDVFYGKILHKEHWKPIANINDNVLLTKEVGHSNELWKFTRYLDGSYEITSCSDGQNLMTTSSDVYVGITDNSFYKRWYIYSYGNGIILRPQGNMNVIELANNSSNDGTDILIKALSGNSNQIFNIYQGYDVQLTAPSLSIDTIEHNKISLSWNSVSSLSNYKIKVYSVEDLDNPIYTNDVSINIKSYTLKLPAGNYVASVTAYNNYQGYQSNEVKFSLTTPISTTVTKKENYLSFSIDLNINGSDGATVLLGLYDKKNKLLSMTKSIYKDKITFDIPCTNTIDYAKIFVWNDFSKLTPLCESEIISEF